MSDAVAMGEPAAGARPIKVIRASGRAAAQALQRRYGTQQIAEPREHAYDGDPREVSVGAREHGAPIPSRPAPHTKISGAPGVAFVAGSLGQFGWNRCHCSGARRIRYSSSCARSCVTRATSSRSAPSRAVGTGGRTTAWWPLRRAREVDADGQDRGAGAQRRASPARPAASCARRRTRPRPRPPSMSRSQSRHTISLSRERPEHRRRRRRAERHDVHAELAAQPDEPVEQLGRLDAARRRRSPGGPGRPASARPTPTRRGGAGRGSTPVPAVERRR